MVVFELGMLLYDQVPVFWCWVFGLKLFGWERWVLKAYSDRYIHDHERK